ncbi:MAG: GNAT family N-acetyltransferase [Mycetocola sp.]
MVDQTRPLSARLAPVPTPRIPEHPAIARWRPATPEDAEAIFALDVAIARVDQPDELPLLNHIIDELGFSYVDLQRDTILGFTADGDLRAAGRVVIPPGHDTRVQSYLNGGVHPELRGQGIGRELLRWQLERSAQQLAESGQSLPGWMAAYTPLSNTAAASLFTRAGLSLARYFVGMHRDVSAPIERVLPREGDDDLRIVPFEPALADSARLSRNDSFRDHWGSQPTVPEEWQSMVSAPQFRYDLSRVAVVGQGENRRVVGFGLVELNAQDWEAQGFTSAYIDYIGVSREARGRRIAPAIIGEVLTAIRDAGFQKALLDVDTESPTGADGLYGRWGFEPGTRVASYVREV